MKYLALLPGEIQALHQLLERQDFRDLPVELLFIQQRVRDLVSGQEEDSIPPPTDDDYLGEPIYDFGPVS